MTKRENKKRALLASVMSLLLCVSMLIGSTFAWFTDTATTGVNKITSGNLDVKLSYNKDCGNTWTNAEKVTDIFTTDKWEPGYTQVVYFKVENAGSLAFDYKVATNVVEETAGVNQEGNPFKLSDSLQFGIVETTAAYADRDAARKAITGPQKFSNVCSGEAILEEGESQIFAMVVWMPEKTGNEANHNGTYKPEIQFGINVIATQATVEEDSFDNQYDKDAKYPALSVETQGELVEAISDGRDVALASDIKLTSAISFDNNADITLDLNGHTLTQKGKITVESGTLTIDDTDGEGKIPNAEFSVNGGELIIESGELCLKNNQCVQVSGGTFTMNDGKITRTDNGMGRLVNVTGGTVNITGGEIYWDGTRTTSNGAFNISGPCTVNMSGGLVKSENGMYAFVVNSNGVIFNINGGAVYSPDYPLNKAEELNITGGSFNIDLASIGMLNTDEYKTTYVDGWYIVTEKLN